MPEKKEQIVIRVKPVPEQFYLVFADEERQHLAITDLYGLVEGGPPLDPDGYDMRLVGVTDANCGTFKADEFKLEF